MTSRTLVLVARTQRLAVALLAVIFVLSAPTAAMAASRPRDAASDAQGRVESARRAANAEGARYMAALSAFEGLRTQAAGVEAAITGGEQRAAALRRIVQHRAARAYMRAGSSLPSLLTVGDLPDLMRSDKLLATANVKDADALSLLNAQQADLRTKREDLRRLEDQQGRRARDAEARERESRRAARIRVARSAGRASAARRAGRREPRDAQTRGEPSRRTYRAPRPGAELPPPSSGGSRSASRRSVPLVRSPAREQRQLRRRQPERPVLRRVPVPRVDVERRRATRVGSTSSASSRRARRRPTRTRSRGASTSGRAPGPGAGAAEPCAPCDSPRGSTTRSSSRSLTRARARREVVVRIGGAGACHSDLHLMHEFPPGLLPFDPPFTLGHENAGWVESVGAA